VGVSPTERLQKKEPQPPVDIHISHRTRQETQPEVEQSTYQEGEAD
jgi:hypothetical protein